MLLHDLMHLYPREGRLRKVDHSSFPCFAEVPGGWPADLGLISHVLLVLLYQGASDDYWVLYKGLCRSKICEMLHTRASPTISTSHGVFVASKMIDDSYEFRCHCGWPARFGLGLIDFLD